MLAERKKVCNFAALEPAKPLNDAQMCGSFYFYSPQNDMRDKLIRLLSDYPSIDVNAMGFPKGWQQEPLWR